MARHKKDGACQRLDRHRLPGRALSRRAARPRFRRSTRCSAPARSRRSSARSAARRSRAGRGTADRSSAAPAPGTRHPHQHPAPARPQHPSRPTSTTPTRRALLATPRHYAYVKIAEGCDYKCAFCIIPTLRGALSQPAGRVDRAGSARARRARRQGAAAHLAGHDVLRHRPQERGALARLLRELNTIDGLEWIRLLYLYPTTIDDDTLAAMAECDKVCKYIDLPLQHASEPGAQAHEAARARGSTTTRCSRRIRDRVPGVALRTTFIVGFPGETERGRRRALRIRERPRVRPRRRLHLLARGRHVGVRAGRRRAGADQDRRAATA